MSLREALLIRRLRDRDEAAFTEIVREYKDRVFGLMLRMIGDAGEAEDLAQEVFITVFKSIDSFRGESSFSTWLYRVAANHCKNRIKHLARRAQSPTDPERLVERSSGAPLQAHIDGPDEALAGRQLERLLEEAIGLLDEEHRLLVVLRDIQELSYQEITEVTGLAEGTVKSRLHRARLAIKEYVERHTQPKTAKR